jgi:hypothetical protein
MMSCRIVNIQLEIDLRTLETAPSHMFRPLSSRLKLLNFSPSVIPDPNHIPININAVSTLILPLNQFIHLQHGTVTINITDRPLFAHHLAPQPPD